MNSTITLYIGCQVVPDRNFVLDEPDGSLAIEAHLSALTSETISGMQYFKHGLSRSLKLDRNQSSLMMGKDSVDLNYVKIVNGEENPIYYFVVGKEWRGEETVKLELAMDTLNTFRFDVDYPVSPKSLTRRMHKPRFDESSISGNNVKRTVDFKSEEISVPLYWIPQDEYELLDLEGKEEIEWSLYYKTADDQENSPVECYLVPSESIAIKVRQDGGRINPLDIPNNKYVVFAATYGNGPLTFVCDGVSASTYYDEDDDENQYYGIVAIKNDGGNLKMYYAKFDDRGLGLIVMVFGPQIAEGDIYVQNAPASVYGHQMDSLPNSYEWFNNQIYDDSNVDKTFSMGTLVVRAINGKDSIDRTLAENIKIINIPYSPTSYSVNADGSYAFSPCWSYDLNTGFLKLNDHSAEFRNTVRTGISDVTSVLTDKLSLMNRTGNGLRSIFDSKLLHSDFYRPKFVYDSFSFSYEMEKIDTTYVSYTSIPFRFDFVMSRNIVSKFAFIIGYYGYKSYSSDYRFVVTVSRNNEEVLYNSAYINYIRMGYNYDLKSKERQEGTTAFGIGLSSAGLLASTVLGAATGNPVAIGGLIASGIGLVSQIANLAKTTAQNEDNIQRKISDARMQGVSVLNGDDFDVMYAYTHNKAKLLVYRVSSQMEKVLSDLFHYGGYLVNEQRVPSVSGRYWFNYAQADLVLGDTANLPMDVEEDIKAKFSAGVTFLHHRKGRFDFAQEMENLENFLIIE